jgi:O-antigen/teichoic acid export membrane protein
MPRGDSLTVKTLLLSVGKIIAALSALLISVVLARTLSVEGFAVHKKAVLAFALISPVLMLGLPKALYFFLPGSGAGARSILVTNLLLLGLSGACFALGLVFVFGDALSSFLGQNGLTRYWWIVGLYGFAMLPLSALSATLVAQNQVSVLVRFQVLSQAVLVTVMALVAYYLRTPVATLTVLMVWSFIAVGVAVLLMLNSTLPGTVGLLEIRGHMKAQLAYAVPLGLASMFGSISTQLDKLMVSNMCSSQDFSWYVAGAIELPIIGIVTGALSAVILPEFARHYKKQEFEQILALWRMAMERSSVILFPCLGGALLFAEDVIILLYTEAFLPAALPFTVYACLLPLRCAVYGSVLMATDRTRWVTYSALFGLVVNLILNKLWIESYGSVGAAWSTVASLYLVVSVMLPQIAKALHARVRDLFPGRHLIKVSVATLVSALLVAVMRTCLWNDQTLGIWIWGSAYGAFGLVMYQMLGLPSIWTMRQYLKR